MAYSSSPSNGNAAPEIPHITSTPISKRPPSSRSWLHASVFNLSFFISMILCHTFQLVFLPLLLIRWKGVDGWFWKINHKCKESFGLILISITQVFGPTTIILTAEEGIDLDKLVTRDLKSGEVASLDLPRRSIIMSNHQMYADWLYIWCLSYYARLHGSIIIILKASLKWVPLVGPAMQLFDFIFLNRSWAADKQSLSSQLSALGQETVKGGPQASVALLIFPEGTLVSPLTRPASSKWAKKSGVDDMKHCLMPRSTGLLFSIRALKQRVPDLALVDLTIGYPGIPRLGYGQDHYTLQSIFGFGQSPPAVHIHLRILPLPPCSLPAPLAPSINPSAELLTALVDPTPSEAAEFDLWLRERWAEKDQLLEKFYTEGKFKSGGIDFGGVGIRSMDDGLRLGGMCLAGFMVGKAIVRGFIG